MHDDPYDYRHYTDTLNPRKLVIGGEQKTHWIEFQLLDERGEPLAHLPYEVINEAISVGCFPECSGHSDSRGVIRIDELHPIPITLKLQANPLADVLQTRRLRACRAEPKRPGVGDHTPLYGPQRSGFSHQQAYSLANAYNLGLMSILAYSAQDKNDRGCANELFEPQCLDLSRTPRVWDNGQAWPCLVCKEHEKYVSHAIPH